MRIIDNDEINNNENDNQKNDNHQNNNHQNDNHEKVNHEKVTLSNYENDIKLKLNENIERIMILESILFNISKEDSIYKFSNTFFKKIICLLTI